MKKLVLLLLLTSAIVVAQPRRMNGGGCGPGECGAGPGKGMIMEKLDLTDNQESQFKEFRSGFEKKNIELHAKIQTLRLTVRDLFDSDKPEQEMIESKLTEISKVQNELKLNGTSFWFNVNSILTADQQKIWKEHSRMMMERFDEERGMGPRGGFGMPGRGPGLRGDGPGPRGFRHFFDRQDDARDDQKDDSEKEDDDSNKKNDNW